MVIQTEVPVAKIPAFALLTRKGLPLQASKQLGKVITQKSHIVRVVDHGTG